MCRPLIDRCLIRALAPLLILLLPLLARADTAAVESNGWVVRYVLTGHSITNGTFQWGFGASNNLVTSTQSVVMTLVSQGFTTNATATTRSRTLYGTKQ